MPRVTFISEQFPNLASTPDSSSWEVGSADVGWVPTSDDSRVSDFILLMGNFGNVAWAEQFVGALGRILSEGPVLIYAYPVAIEAAGALLLQRLVGITPLSMGEPQPVAAAHSAFDEYFAVFGKSAMMLESVEGSETLGTIVHAGQTQPAAITVPRLRGAVYAVPFYFGGAEGHFGKVLLEAITAHRADVAGTLPAFLTSLRLPGEQQVLDGIAETQRKLQELGEQAAHLEHFRLLLGPRGTGTALETLVIEALNVVLDGSEHRAEDRPDLRAEDFWIVGPAGDAALAEVKGVNTNVRREDVNQVDSHRETAGKSPEFPGLLVFNIFRGHETLDQRQLAIPDQTLARAANSNVLILRTQDLYNLVHRKLAGEDAGLELTDALEAGGGWLEVTSDAVAMKKPSQ